MWSYSCCNNRDWKKYTRRVTMSGVCLSNPSFVLTVRVVKPSKRHLTNFNLFSLESCKGLRKSRSNSLHDILCGKTYRRSRSCCKSVKKTTHPVGLNEMTCGLSARLSWHFIIFDFKTHVPRQVHSVFLTFRRSFRSSGLLLWKGKVTPTSKSGQ